MIKRLLPKEYHFYDFFERHISLCEKVVEELVKSSDNFDSIAASYDRIKEYRKQMTEIHNQTIEAVIVTFITPFERSDIHRLIKRMNEIGKSVDSAVGRIILYELKEIKPEFVQLSAILSESVQNLRKAVYLLKDMKNQKQMQEACDRINRLEDEADDVFKSALGNLFRTNDIIEIMKWKEVLEKIEKAVDRCKLSSLIIEAIMISAA